MNFIKNIISFYTQNTLLNTVILIAAAILCWVLWTYRKLKVMALAASIKAELKTYLKGEQKLNFALEWLMKQEFFKNTILKFIPAKIVKWVINTVFNTNRETIEAK
ncbi:hypothetical protein [Sebaldella sp. S0638]|uniref:hypothetical protein n=1 Tax=Sebaldella sp. S0638 TaxID=2957809 RepID=UPI0020A0F946|nr:hypothetical protein [Sebaldella sp. S0638]MCP1226398.1 hypothetical protein [Sebaldella sp. S0638]